MTQDPEDYVLRFAGLDAQAWAPLRNELAAALDSARSMPTGFQQPEGAVPGLALVFTPPAEAAPS